MAEESTVRETKLADTVANTLEWIITAFILAFVFRAFVMEAFRIPTGSMAATLKGAHFRLACPQCGYQYDYGFMSQVYNVSEEYVPSGSIPIRPENPRCPSCGYLLPGDSAMPVSNGDRILVLKTIYQFLEPDRWDVVVFRTPTQPMINYIKRMIGRPGETVQIIDGDIYINGRLARKPPSVQDILWMPVYNNDYQPLEPRENRYNRHTWREPFENTDGSRWRFMAAGDGQAFSLESGKDAVSTVMYNSAVGNDFRDAYAYNPSREYEFMPIVSDLKLSFNADIGDDAGVLGITLSKYQTVYRAFLDTDNVMTITAELGGQKTVLATKRLSAAVRGGYVPVSFATLDHQLIFKVGHEEVYKDLGREPNAAGPRTVDLEPQVGVFGSGKLVLHHIALNRDIHYTSVDIGKREPLRGSETRPVVLGKDEFFCMGDNSPSSSDSRYWPNPGIGNGTTRYRAGIVPRDYLVGKAVFVYWPGGFKPFGVKTTPWPNPALVPNFGALRFIYGGVGTYN